MSFITDKQTLEDLNLLGKYRPHSILSIFNQTRTQGGARILESMFNNPLSDPGAINQRVRSFRCFEGCSFPFDEDQVRAVDGFLGMDTGASTMLTMVQRRLQSGFLHDERYRQLTDGLHATLSFINRLRTWLPTLDKPGHPYKDRFQQLATLVNDHRLANTDRPRTLLQTARYVHHLKRVLHDQLEQALEIVYELDVHISVANLAVRKGFTYAEAHLKNKHVFRAEALWHPAVPNPIVNAIELDQQQNMLFLTGANMAGKSTFMKAFGIAAYLAHMGFPVAARNLQFSVRDGLCTSINVGDNLAQGYSHFYAEVLRVKTVAKEVSEGKDLIIIFDELFKGTNVKDAYDATLAVTRLLSRYRNCLYIISTHIIEVGEELRESSGNIIFGYLPTIMEGSTPRYTYRMAEGITSDKHGMMIISNEGIIEILKHKNN